MAACIDCGRPDADGGLRCISCSTVANDPTPEAVEAAREIIRPLGDSAIADIHRKRAEGIIQAAIDAATARLAAENDDLRWALKKLAGQFRIDSALRAIVDARLDGHPKPRALYDRYAEQKDENARLAAERDEARAVLRAIITMPAVREVLAPRGSLGSLLDAADAALAPPAGGG